MRMRTKLLFALLSVSFGLTAASLFIIRVSLEHQIRERILDDLTRSLSTFQNLQAERRETLLHDAALLADLPSLKALMSSGDRRTIQDGGAEFWKVSGSDLLALANPDGDTVAIYNQGARLNEESAAKALRQTLSRTENTQYLMVDGRLYEVSVQPLYFGPVASGTRLGFVVSGYEINHQVAQEVSQAAAAEVAFCTDGGIAASTLAPGLKASLLRSLPHLARSPEEAQDIWVSGEHFLVASVPLSNDSSPDVRLLVLKSYDQASVFLRRLNRLIVILGLCVLLAGGLMAVYIAGTITGPLESLATGALALGSGDFQHRLPSGGTTEIRDLSKAFDHMRLQLRQTQQELLETERLATIGRMASSISHDLRHHLSAVYANAEFLGYSALEDKDRAELLGEIQLAVQEMTALIDSLLMFSRTGQTLHLSPESLPLIVERAVSLLKTHPAAAGIRIHVNVSFSSAVWVDAKKLERAVYNLLLNACQAIGRDSHEPLVTVSSAEDGEWVRLRFEDNGPGVAESIRLTLFEPFVSAGKQNGIGLGLTLAHSVAQEHSGNVTLESSGPSGTVFVLSIARDLRHASSAGQYNPSAGEKKSQATSKDTIQAGERREFP